MIRPPLHNTIHLYMKSLFPFILLFIFLTFSACGQKTPSAVDGASDNNDSLLSQQMADAGPNEDEIASLTDTARQETPKALDEKYQGLHIYVSKTTMHLYVLDRNDSVLFSCGIACGARRGNKTRKGDYKTPEGDFSISGLFNSTDWIHRTRDGRSVKGCYGPHFLRLATGRLGGIGIHGTNAPGSIGKRASEGCIRVNSANIVILYDNYAYNGMPVTVSAEGAPLPAFKGLVPAVTKNKVVKDTIDKVQRFEHETKCNVHDAELHTKTHDHLERSHAVDADSLFE